MKHVIWGRFVWVREVFYVLEKTFHIQNLMHLVFDHDLYMCCEWVYMMMFCICRRRSRSRDRSNRKRSHSPADRHGSSRYKRSRSRERDRYIYTVIFFLLSCICLSVSNVWGLWGTSINEEISESWTRTVKVHLKFQVCSFEPAMVFLQNLM